MHLASSQSWILAKAVKAPLEAGEEWETFHPISELGRGEKAFFFFTLLQPMRKRARRLSLQGRLMALLPFKEAQEGKEQLWLVGKLGHNE